MIHEDVPQTEQEKLNATQIIDEKLLDDVQAENANDDETQAKLIKLQQEIEELKKQEVDLILRNKADIENIKKRAEQDVEKAHKFALEKIAKELILVIDNLERSLEVKSEQDDEKIKPFFEGVSLTLKNLIDVVNRFNIVSVGTIGENFNPDVHQAISTQKDENFSSNTVINVLQKGYTLNNRVIRPAMVIVCQ